MTRKRRRLIVLMLFLVGLGTATTLSLFAFQDSLVFFFSPSDLASRPLPADRAIRVGGLVEPGSVARGPATEIRFRITDGATQLPVVYSGILPDLFREGQGVVTEGSFDAATHAFVADSVLAKHDENYMPKEVADRLKKDGVWEDGTGKGMAPAKDAKSGQVVGSTTP